MPGLIDATTGLSFGDGLTWTNGIGGPGLTIAAGGVTPSGNMVTEYADNMLTEDGNQMVTETA